DQQSRRWVVFSHVPVGIAARLLSPRVVSDPPHLIEAKKKVGPIDGVGLGLIAVGLGALEYVLDKGQEDEWFASNAITGCAILAAAALIVFVIWEWRQKHPVVEVKLFRDRDFSLSTLLMLVLGIALYGSTVLLPQYMQAWMGYSAQDAGMALSPGALTVSPVLPLVRKSSSRTD